MSHIKDALLHVVRAARVANKYERAMEPYQTPYSTIIGMLTDAVYELVGGDTGTIDVSKVFLTIKDGRISDKHIVEILMNAHDQNWPEQPKPYTMSREEVNDLYRNNGGYQSPEGEWK